MHVTIETQAAFAEGTLSAAETRTAHAHLLTCHDCSTGVADQLAIIHAMSQLPPPLPTGDGWPALAAALGPDWQAGTPDTAAPAVKPSRPYVFSRRHRWVAAALLTVGLAGSLILTFAQPAPADDEIDSFWREHHSFSAHNNVSGRHMSSYQTITSTHRMNQHAP